MERRCTLHSDLLAHHLVDHGGAGAEHHLGELVVGHLEAEVFKLLFVELLGDHVAEHLLLQQGLVDLLSALLCVLVGGLHLALEFLNVDFLSADLGDGGAGAEECAARSEEVTDDERQKRHADDNEQKHRFASDFL